MDYRLEVVGIPVSDVDDSIDFYVNRVGFHLDHDIEPGPGMRVVQMTPSGSPSSVVIGRGLPLGEPGTTKGLQLVVEDIDAAQAELAETASRSPTSSSSARGKPRLPVRVLQRSDGNGWSLRRSSGGDRRRLGRNWLHAEVSSHAPPQPAAPPWRPARRRPPGYGTRIPISRR